MLSAGNMSIVCSSVICQYQHSMSLGNLGNGSKSAVSARQIATVCACCITTGIQAEVAILAADMCLICTTDARPVADAADEATASLRTVLLCQSVCLRLSSI